VEDVTGIDAIYTADNGQGYVCVIGEQFIGVDANGAILAQDIGELADTVTTAIEAIKATELSDVDLTQYEGIHKNVVSAQKTATGNYVLEIKGAGYGIKGGDDYHPASGKYIEIRICLTPEGKILDVITTFQEESKGIGDACANEKFYGQFDGKTEGNFKEIDAIGGATMTTNGYLEAIEVAFASMKILEGGAN
jgi:hypothetical protein